jgi:coenzyme PQQ precursor peptide PqqA
LTFSRADGTGSARFDTVCQNEPKPKRPRESKRKFAMAWTTPTLVEICIGLEINGYLPAEI